MANLHSQTSRQLKETAGQHAEQARLRESGDSSWLSRSSRSAFTSTTAKKRPDRPILTRPPVPERSQQQSKPVESSRVSAGIGLVEQQPPVLSSCSGSTVSLNARLDDSETQSAHPQRQQSRSEPAQGLPRWGAKRRATSRCIGGSLEEPGSALPRVAGSCAREKPLAEEGLAAASGEVRVRAPATPLRPVAAGSSDNPGKQKPAGSSLLRFSEGASGHAVDESSRRPAEEQQLQGLPDQPKVSPQVSQAPCPNFSADPLDKRLAVAAFRRSQAHSRLAELARLGHFAPGSLPLAPPQAASSSNPTWSAHDPHLRPVASSTLQLAPPSLLQTPADHLQTATGPKPLWSDHAAQALPSEAHPAHAGSLLYAHELQQSGPHARLPSYPSAPDCHPPAMPAPAAPSQGFRAPASGYHAKGSAPLRGEL